MNRYAALTWHDLKGMGRDPMLAVGFLGPLALLIGTRYGFPLLDAFVEDQFAVQLHEHSLFMSSLFMLIAPMLIGMMAGFVMLDERDEQMVSYYTVTPLTRRGYLLLRLGLPTALSIVMNVMFLTLSRLEPFVWSEQLAVLVMLALQTPMFALFLVGFASNKVEGVALSKLGGLFLAGPIFVFFIPGLWSWVGAIFPMFWTARVYVLNMQPADYALWLHMIYDSIGIGFHVLVLYDLLRRFELQGE